MTELEARAYNWLESGGTGASSKAIWQHMMGRKQRETWGPADPADLGRCLRLLEKIPEWKPRMPEMAAVSEEWRRIVPHWDRLSEMMAEEVGIYWDKGREAPKTYAAMLAVRKDRT